MGVRFGSIAKIELLNPGVGLSRERPETCKSSFAVRPAADKKRIIRTGNGTGLVRSIDWSPAALHRAFPVQTDQSSSQSWARVWQINALGIPS